jgi:phage baseplate assembly protein gpV
MAIDSGIALDCVGLVEVGGIQNVFVTDLSNLNTVTAAGAGGYSSLVGTTTWAMFQVKPNTATYSVTSSYDNGLTSYETTISWYIPNIGSARAAIVRNMENACLVAVAEFRSGKFRTCGISQAYTGFGNGNNFLYNDTYARMTVEGTSGTDFVDGNGVTITLTATSFEYPRVYTGGVTYGAGNVIATLT